MIAFDQTKPLLKDGKDIQYQGQTAQSECGYRKLCAVSFVVLCCRFPCRGQHTKINIENQVKG